MNRWGRYWVVGATGFVLLGTGQLWADFPNNDPPGCPDVFSTNAGFRIVLLDGTTAESLNLSGPTVVGRSNPFAEGDPLDANAPICDAGPGSNYPNMWASVPDAWRMPPGWPESQPARREVHTEILSLVLQGTGVTIRAGQPFYANVANTPQAPFFQYSIGEVASQDPTGDPNQDFPADSFFNVYVQVDLGFTQLYNSTPLVLIRKGITGFPPPDISQPLGEYDHLDSVPLFDESGLPFGFLVNGAHGGVGDLPLCDAPLLIPGPLSFGVDPNSIGLDPAISGVTPNRVWDDRGTPPQQVTVYYSPAVGAIPNMTNERDPRLTGATTGWPNFQPGDMITGLSFGRDGTGPYTGNLFFSVGRGSVGVYPSDVWLRSTRPPPLNAVAGDIYVSAVGPFGAYLDTITPAQGQVNTNRLAAAAPQLGLRGGVLLQFGEDNLTALELSRFEDADRYAFFTFKGPSFTGNEATIYVYDRTMGPFDPNDCRPFAVASNLRLVAGDKIDALALSDVTLGSLTPNGVMDPYPGDGYYYDEVLFSLAPGSPTLTTYGLSAADIFYSDFSGGLWLFATAANLGLLPTDDVDALDIKPTGECALECPAGGIPEPEPCGADLDGGCNISPPMFAPIACGDVICGTLWANTSLRDTDWYQLTLPQAQYLTWTAESQVPLLIFIIQGAGPNDCSSYSILASATAGECQTASLTLEGSAGVTYWFWAGPSAWSDWPCDKDYTASLTCAAVPTGACCLQNGNCIEINPSGCAGLGGIYQGNYVSCDNVVCVPFYCPGSGGCDEYISRVQVDVIDNPTPCTMYGDYTALGPAILAYGSATTLTVTNGNPIWTSDYCRVWIDYNHDYVWDASEVIGTVPGVGPYVFTIVPPMSALPGLARMRIRIDYANANPNPCFATSYGEVEDYTVNVMEVYGACCWGDGTCTQELPSTCYGYWAGPFTECSGLDCNFNGIDDFCDIVSQTSTDCNGNGIPDECEVLEDCNFNGVPDICDIAWCTGEPWCSDCNENWRLDECDIGDGTSEDCQPDGIPDDCQLGGGGLQLQIDDGTSENNWGLTAGGELCWMNHFTGTGSVSGISCTFGSAAYPGMAGVTPGQAIRVYVWSDPNGDGSPVDAVFLGEGAGAVDAGSIDTDVVQPVTIGPIAVSTSFFIGCSVVTTSGYPATADDDGQTLVDQGFLTFNSIPFDPTSITTNLYPMSALGYPTTVFILRVGGGGAPGGGDCNNNGIPDFCDVPPPMGNCEGPDCSQDCQPNGVPDECEPDCQPNGRPDDCDIASGSSLDCNGNGVPDECDIRDGPSLDCNGNLIPDECELVDNDCNNNGIPDECDIAAGGCDCQGDGIPDECQLADKAREELSWDDGSSENSLGLTAGGELCWMAHFTTPDPTCTVLGIKTCFGTPLYPGSSGVSAGQAVRVYVWTDPNGDGNPTDAVFMGESTGTVSGGSIDSDVLQTIAINQTVSGSFFVGASVVTTSGYPSPMDENGPQYNQAWIVFNTVPFNPVVFGASLYNMTDIGYPCNWLLRAEISCGPLANDCNGNQIPDECDIGVQWGGFCATPGIPCFPPECVSDWNHNGVPDNCEICGDLDNDGNVDLDDYWMFLDAFGTCVGDPKYNAAADMDLDGCVTLVDYQAWRMCYKMANGKDFVAPKPKPMPKPAKGAVVK